LVVLHRVLFITGFSHHLKYYKTTTQQNRDLGFKHIYNFLKIIMH
jgi:hypothetical protein